MFGGWVLVWGLFAFQELFATRWYSQAVYLFLGCISQWGQSFCLMIFIFLLGTMWQWIASCMGKLNGKPRACQQATFQINRETTCLTEGPWSDLFPFPYSNYWLFFPLFLLSPPLSFFLVAVPLVMRFFLCIIPCSVLTSYLHLQNCLLPPSLVIYQKE